MFKANVNSPFTFLLVLILAGGLLVWFSEDHVTMQPRTEHKVQIKSWQTSKGSKVVFVEAKELPMLDVQVVFDAGSARDGQLSGLASFTHTMLDNGAGEWTTDQIAERNDSIGASIGGSSERDMAVVSLRCLTDEKIQKKALATLQAVLQSPHFPEKEIERERKQLLIGLKNEQQSPSEIVSKLFYKNLYGKHPYGTPVSGDMQSAKQLSREAMLKFYQQYYVASNAVVAIVGDVSEERARQIAEQLTGGLEKGSKAKRVSMVKGLSKASTITHQHPSTQTHIMVGQPGMMRGDVDYFALYVGNHILGGSGFGSRIVDEVREKRGLAYSSYSYFIPMRDKGPFLMGLQTQNTQADEALKVLRETLTRFIDEGPTAAELDHSIKNITGGFPLRIDSNRDIVGYLGMLGFYDLPLDYLQTFNDNIQQVTRERIKQAFKSRIQPDRMLTVMVGKLDTNKKQP
ncbi:MAG: insulinase family protein [Gammaproteobacteria bacterium]|nr:insulinase family protein [Gammaproteobacteria bacterium]